MGGGGLGAGVCFSAAAKPALQLKHARRERVSLKAALTGHDLLIGIALLEDNRAQMYLMATTGEVWEAGEGKVTDR